MSADKIGKDKGISCPECGSTDFEPVAFTWWGGALGPLLLGLVKCRNCGKKFNGRTGKSNTVRILIYAVVIIIIAIIVGTQAK